MKLIVIFIVNFLLSTFCFAEKLYGRVISVSDGDTISILNDQKIQFKIRLTGIDAPEKNQAFGQKSKNSLSQLIYSKDVLAECGKVDRYQRYLCKIKLGDTDINLQQIKLGMAWHYKQYAKDQPHIDRETYSKSEDMAKLQRTGLWIDKQPIPPWEWRRR